MFQKPKKGYKAKRPTRDEYQLEELGDRLVEAKEEESELLLEVWGEEQEVRGRIVALDSRTRKVHVAESHGELRKIPFLDIMNVNRPR
ncbi:YolD-like family protein [Paenibacillus daejeonensis]|uniref:YolD-like family protein n=1 Tax=Paenibacillus daejeonensis TaxID=135193 RepID=UPI0003728F65|nr:YolD-like family protein [Paenibacillus daejeonensis]